MKVKVNFKLLMNNFQVVKTSWMPAQSFIYYRLTFGWVLTKNRALQAIFSLLGSGSLSNLRVGGDLCVGSFV